MMREIFLLRKVNLYSFFGLTTSCFDVLFDAHRCTTTS